MKSLALAFIALTLIGCGAPKSADTPKPSVAIINEAHGYADNYTPDKLETLKSTGKPFAVFVGADWCPGCKRLTKEIIANQIVLPKDTAILTANFDNELALRREYGVAVKHTGIFFDANGEHLYTKGGVVFADFMTHLAKN